MAGRPLKYRSAQKLSNYIDKYFEEQDSKDKKYTITGLAVWLGMTRKQLIEYQDRVLFKNVIKAAKSRIEAQVEELMLSGKAQAGCIFWLKNQGWQDVQQIQDITQLTKDELLKRIQQTAGKAIPISKAA